MNHTAIKKIRQKISDKRVDAFLVTKDVNVSYLSRFKAEGALLITPTKQILVVDARFTEQAGKEDKTFQVWQRQKFYPLEEGILPLVKKLKLKRLGFESLALSYYSYQRLKAILAPVKLVATTNMIEHLRAIKKTNEIRLLKKAASIAIKGYLFARKITKAGKQEVEIARELQYFMRKLGAEDSAFDIIVASGKRSSMPHAFASHKIIKAKEAVLFDLGCRISGYNSNLTRMFFLSKIKGKIKRIYEIVLQAQQRAIMAIRAGVKICEIDRIARQYITKEGLGEFFGHALGHGIGREVHEYPSISPKNQDELQKDMVFTVEPAVYIPDWGGIRIEDMVLVTKNGCEILTK